MPKSQNWCDSKRWSENWTVLCKLESGGQGTAKLVTNNETGGTAFLKVLSRQGDPERRARFFREASAYATANHPGIPALIESNAQHHQDLDYKIYLVTEYVDGPTLTGHVEAKGPLSFSDSASILSGLADVARYCHANEWIHRDIKPDNIILRNGDSAMPVLLDFGIAYNGDIVHGFETDFAQELGNRFLRLPEMSAGSSAKQDRRTDISFLGGIFYYLLTALPPSVLTNEEGRMPHQRALSAERLRSLFGGRPQALFDFFDRTFSQKLSGRFVDTLDMKTSLDRLIGMNEKRDPGVKELSIEDILSELDTKAGQDLKRNKALYDLAMNNIGRVHKGILARVQPTYISYQTGYADFVDGLRNDLGFAHFATHDHRFVPSFLMKILGEELVVIADGVAIYRTEVDAPVFSAEFDRNVEKIYLSGLKQLIDRLPGGA